MLCCENREEDEDEGGAMRKLLLASVAFVALDPIGAALAADPPVFSFVQIPGLWTGPYGGLNAGGDWANTHFTWSPNLAAFGPFNAAALAAAADGHIDPMGAIAGGQIGYNYAFGPWLPLNIVAGLEADMNYTGLSGSRTANAATTFPFAGATVSEKFYSDWLSTVRGRLGLSFGEFLFYGTGGLAIAEVGFSDMVFVPPAGGTHSNPGEAGSRNSTRLGWVAGGGGEWAFMPNWSLKLEYLHVDLGNTSNTSVAFPPQTILHSHSLTEEILRVGINYHFNWFQ
jgi:outer membrane immunogenic protein